MNDRFLAAALVAAAAVGCNPASRSPGPPPSTLVEGEPMYDVLPPEAIPAVDAPEFVSGEEADAQMSPDEPVLGVVGADGVAKCYSCWQLENHEIVNDALGQLPVMVTW